jgi:hypothetical protein
MLIRLTPNASMASMYLMSNTKTSGQALMAETITDEQCRELRGHPIEVHARALRNAAESRAGRKFNAARDEAFTFFGSTDVEQAARANAIAHAEAKRTEAVNAAVSRWRAACARILNARAEVT